MRVGGGRSAPGGELPSQPRDDDDDKMEMKRQEGGGLVLVL